MPETGLRKDPKKDLKLESQGLNLRRLPVKGIPPPEKSGSIEFPNDLFITGDFPKPIVPLSDQDVPILKQYGP